MKRFAVVVLCVSVLQGLGACTYLHPTLGQLPDDVRQERIAASPNYADGRFLNQVDTPQRTNAFTFFFAVIRGWFEPRDRPRPSSALPTVKTDLRGLAREQDTVVWLGHSSYFVQLGGRRLLVDL